MSPLNTMIVGLVGGTSLFAYTIYFWLKVKEPDLSKVPKAAPGDEKAAALEKALTHLAVRKFQRSRRQIPMNLLVAVALIVGGVGRYLTAPAADAADAASSGSSKPSTAAPSRSGAPTR
jgi:hypothetical protein